LCVLNLRVGKFAHNLIIIKLDVVIFQNK